MLKQFRKSIGMAGLVAVALAAGSSGALAEEVKHEWQMSTPWSGGPWLERDAKGFADRVRMLTEGRVDITTYPAGTLTSPLRITDAVRRGVVQAGHNWPGYDWGRSRTTTLFSGWAGGHTPEGYMLWLYEGGALELFEEYRLEEFDVISIPCSILHTDIMLHSRKPVRTVEDFKGLKLRSAGSWVDIAQRLGAETISVPGGEVYDALERGVIDAVELGSPEINLPIGVHDIAEYIITPGLHNPGGFSECQFNRGAWSQLSEHDQRMVKLAGRLNMYDTWAAGNLGDLNAWAKLKQGRNEIIRFPNEELNKIRKVANEWADEEAQKDEWFARVLESERELKEHLKHWPEYRMPIGSLAQPID